MKKKPERRYGVWSGCPAGHPEYSVNCVETVWHDWLSAQCSRKRGHGPEGLYCKQHGKRQTALENG